MISKNELKYLKSLKIKKYRTKEKKILIEGFRLIRECINSKSPIECIYYSQKFANNKNNVILIDIIKEKIIPFKKICQIDINHLSDSVNNQGIIGVIKIQLPKNIEDYKDNQLILDSISDPGNLGSIMRTADWFGLSAVYLSENCIDPYNPKVIRSAMGAHFYINTIQISIIRHIKLLKKNNFKIIGADISGDSIYDSVIPDKWAIILGSEAHGISEEVKNIIDYKITIPKKGSVESLNVAMAGGILLSHIKNKD